MNRALRVVAVAAAFVVAAECRAQFFDDFDGDALAPHWQILDDFPGAWDYHVSGGLLTVNSLNSPASMGSPQNYQRIDASFPPVSGDWVARVVMGWEPGSMREMRIRLTGEQLGSLGEFAMREGASDGRLVMISSGQLFTAPAPEQGLHEFLMQRQGNQLLFSFDGQLFATLPASSPNQAVARVRIGFDVDYPSGLPMNPLYVDRIHIVPSPSGVLLFATLGVLQLRRRR